MKYQKIYDALQTGGARIDLDQSGWRAIVPTIGLPASVRSGLWPKSPGFI